MQRPGDHFRCARDSVPHEVNPYPLWTGLNILKSMPSVLLGSSWESQPSEYPTSSAFL